jgi:2,4-dienoyl-CoA reductase-like NADH-dependent reductase (Old Yellow Enzyme family)
MKKQDVEKTTLKNLTAPVKVGPFELKNRMVLSPMNETMSGMNGESTDQCNAYFGARAKGGAGMVITGAIMATKLASEFVWGRNLYCFHSGHQQGLSMLTDRIHYFGSLASAARATPAITMPWLPLLRPACPMRSPTTETATAPGRPC